MQVRVYGNSELISENKYICHDVINHLMHFMVRSRGYKTHDTALVA